MFPELYLPVGYIVLVSLLLLRDEYRTWKINKKRLDARAKLIWPVRVETISGPFQGETKNISATGAFLVCRQPLYRGEIVRLIIKAPSRSLEVDAEIIWSSRHTPSHKDFPHNGIGVRFKRISSTSRSFLALAVHNRLNADKRSQAQVLER
jgi:hypothetical protein